MSSPEFRPTEPPGATETDEQIVAPESPEPVEPQRAEPPPDEEPDEYEPV